MSQAQGLRIILFVCRGNLCRSPMAMALLRHRLQSEGRAECVQVDSAGYYDWEPFPREAHPFARRAVTHVCGNDLLANHSAKRWTPKMIGNAALVVVAEEWMRDDFPPGRVVTMRELAGAKGDVEDPYGGDYTAYLECVRELDHLIVAGMSTLLGERCKG